MERDLVAMKLSSCKLVTIIAEAALEEDLVEALGRIGVRGYTLSEARGRGAHGVRDSSFTLTANLRIEIVCDADVAQDIASEMSTRFYDHYAMILFVSDVDVLRPDKFSGRQRSPRWPR